MMFFWFLFNIIWNIIYVNSLTFITQNSCGISPSCIYANANMFDIGASGGKDIRITGLKIACEIGIKTVLVYRLMTTGGYSSYITNRTSWALEAERQINCNGFSSWTDIGGLNVFIPNGERIGFIIHIPIFIDSLVYTDEADKSNADITVYDGLGIDYTLNPFGFDITVNDYATRRMPNIEISYEIADNYLSTDVSPTSPIFNAGIMFDIVTKSNPVRIKSFDIQCVNAGNNIPIKIYARTTYVEHNVNKIQSDWMAILDTTFNCPTVRATINVGRLTNDAYIPALTTYGFYIDVFQTSGLVYYEILSDITGNDIDIKHGFGVGGNNFTRGIFQNRIFSGRIYYEIVNCYLSQTISQDGSYALTSMTTENPNNEGNNGFTFIYGITNYLCFTIGSSYTCPNPRITASLVDNDYSGIGESFEMSIVDGLTIAYNLIWKYDSGTQGNCNNKVSPSNPIAINEGSSLTSSNGQIVVALKNNYQVDNVCYSNGFSPEQSQSMNVDVILSCVPPTNTPTQTPTLAKAPTNSPTPAPSDSPTAAPTPAPTNSPTLTPTHSPTPSPTPAPTDSPTNLPSTTPIIIPSNNPSITPTENPALFPTNLPSTIPTISPAYISTEIPTGSPTITPMTQFPTIKPSKTPSKQINQNSLGNDKKEQNNILFVGVGIGLGIGLIFTIISCIFCKYYFQKKGQTTQVSSFSQNNSNDAAQLNSMVALPLSNITPNGNIPKNENEGDIYSNDTIISDPLPETKGNVKPDEFVTNNGQINKEGESQTNVTNCDVLPSQFETIK